MPPKVKMVNDQDAQCQGHVLEWERMRAVVFQTPTKRHHCMTRGEAGSPRGKEDGEKPGVGSTLSLSLVMIAD